MQNDPKSQSRAVRTRKVNSILIKLEREIAGVADRIRGGVGRAQGGMISRNKVADFMNATKQKLARVSVAFSARSLAIAVSARKMIGDFVKATKQKLTRVSAAFRARGLAISESARKLIGNAIYSRSRPSARKSNVVPPAAPMMGKNPTSGRGNALEHLFISASLGLVGICGILILVLFIQIRDLKTRLALSEMELATNKAHLNRVEKLAQQPVVKEPTPAKKTQPAHLPLDFSEADKKIIRQYIKVLPPKPGDLQKIHLGDDITNSAVAPVPESLIEQLPRLRGARFSIDQDGSIIIVGEGSNRVDAVLSYN